MKKLRASARVTEVDSVSDTLIRLYNSYPEIHSDKYLSRTIEEIIALSAEITQAIKKDKVESNLSAADGKRGDVVRRIGIALKGYAALPIPEKSEAAEKLLAVFKKYGAGIVNESYARESSLIESMLSDFSADSLDESIAALDGIPELLTSLRKLQNEFNQVSDDYNAAMSIKSESATELKKLLLSAINDKLATYVSAMALSNPAAFEEFVAKADTEISRINATVAKRGKSGGEKESAQQDTEDSV